MRLYNHCFTGVWWTSRRLLHLRISLLACKAICLRDLIFFLMLNTAELKLTKNRRDANDELMQLIVQSWWDVWISITGNGFWLEQERLRFPSLESLNSSDVHHVIARLPVEPSPTLQTNRAKWYKGMRVMRVMMNQCTWCERVLTMLNLKRSQECHLVFEVKPPCSDFSLPNPVVHQVLSRELLESAPTDWAHWKHRGRTKRLQSWETRNIYCTWQL